MKHEVAEGIFESLVDKKELLTLALTFASMIFESEADQQWLRRRIGMLDDIIRETCFYQDILKQGLEEGREEGREEGKHEGLYVALLDIIQDRFPSIVELAKEQIEPIKDSMVLRRLIVGISTVQSAEKAQQYIEELGKESA